MSFSLNNFSPMKVTDFHMIRSSLWTSSCPMHLQQFLPAFHNQAFNVINISQLAFTSLVERCLIRLLQQAKMIIYDLVFHRVLHKF